MDITSLTAAVEAFFRAQPPQLLLGAGFVLALLILGSLAALVMPRLQPGRWDDLGQRMKSWWVICTLAWGALFAGTAATTVFFGLVAFIALREFLSLAPTRKDDRLVVGLAFLAIPIAFGAVLFDNYDFFLTLIPVYLFTGLAFTMAWIGRTERFLATAGTIYWGVVVCVTNIAYIPFLMQVPASENMPAGAAGLVFFLLLSTQWNDVAQYIVGKSLGKSAITPTVSPKKTWGGFIGGMVTTAALIFFVGPYFLPLDIVPRAILAVLLPLAGFAGDITMSAIKRDIGVKDSSGLIPGHGGMLDRIDSLSFTAPIYFHILAFYALERF